MQYKIRKLTVNDFDEVAKFIARLNAQPRHNICDLGTDSAEIKHFIKDDLLDLDAVDGFCLAYDNETLVGVWGLDYDDEKGYLYSLGPYIDHHDWHAIAASLWERIQTLIPSGAKEITISANTENTNCIEFAKVNDFILEIVGNVLLLKQEDFKPLDHSRIVELTPDFQEQFKALHDKTFPGTYYSGDDILGRCNDIRKVFVTNPVTGYIYVEPQPEFGEANLEFIGVDESERGKGLGKALLSKGIDYVFSFDTINEITLSVREGNPAQKLYEKLGFSVDSTIHSYQLIHKKE